MLAEPAFRAGNRDSDGLGVDDGAIAVAHELWACAYNRIGQTFSIELFPLASGG